MIKKMSQFFLFLLVIVLFSAFLKAENNTPRLTNPINIKTLTSEEKLGQILMYPIDIDNTHKYKDAIKKGIIGNVIILWGSYSFEDTKNLIKKLQGWASESPRKIPLLIAINYEGSTVFTPVTLGLLQLPTNMQIAASNDTQNTARLFYLAGKEMKRAGFNINFAPVVDVNTNSNNPVIGLRSFGSYYKNVAKMSSAVINGLQASGVIAVAKHFPGHGDTSKDSHYSLPYTNLSKEELQKHLYPFKKAIQSQVGGIMSAHVVYPNLDPKYPATFSKKILTNLLKKEMNFKGIVISDSLDMKGATKGQGHIEASTLSLQAGADMLIVGKYNPEKTFKKLKKLIGTEISAKRLHQASKKIIEAKNEIFYHQWDKLNGYEINKAYDKVAQNITNKAITLIKDEQNILPLAKNGDTEDKLKVCSVFFVPSRFSEFLTNFKKPFLASGIELDYYNAFVRPNYKDYNRARKCVKNADVTVIGSFQMNAKPISSQVKYINKLIDLGKPVILVSLMSPYDILHYPNAKTVMAIYGITKYSSKSLSEVLLNGKALGKFPVEIN